MDSNQFNSKKTRKKIKELLKSTLNFEQIKNQILNHTSNEKNKKISFENTKYSKNGNYRFPYNKETAEIIFEKSIFYTNTFDLMCHTYFEIEATNPLNLHNYISSFDEFDIYYNLEDIDEIENTLEQSDFFKSNLDRKTYFQTLEISKWSYQDFILSAIFFYLENLYENYLLNLKEKDYIYISSLTNETIKFRKNTSFGKLEAFVGHNLSVLLLHKVFGKSLLNVLQQTNLFNVFPLYGIRGITTRLETYGFPIRSDDEDDENFTKVFYNYINSYSKNLEFPYISSYLELFQSIIPAPIIAIITEFSCQTKTTFVLYYVLKKYENQLIKTKSLKNKIKQDRFLNNQIISIKTENNKKIFNLTNLFFFISLTNLVYLNPDFTFLSIFWISNNLNKNLTNFSANFPTKPEINKNILDKPPQKLTSLNKSTQKTKIPNLDLYNQKSWVKSFNKPVVYSGKNFVFDPKTKLYTQVGRFNEYQVLKKDIKYGSIQAKENGLKPLVPLDVDHIFPKNIHSLMGLSGKLRNETNCIICPKTANLAKQYSGKGQSINDLFKIETNFWCLNLNDVSNFLLDQSITGMFDYLEKNNLKEIELLDTFGAFEALKKSYIINKTFAIQEIKGYANIWQLQHNYQAVGGIFLINHIIEKMNKLEIILTEYTEYNNIKQQFKLVYVLRTISEQFQILCNLVNSFMLNLNIISFHPFSQKIKNQIENLSARLKIATTSALQNYELNQKLYNLPILTQNEKKSCEKSIKSYDSSFSSNIYLSSIEIFNRSELKSFNIGNYRNIKNSPFGFESYLKTSDNSFFQELNYKTYHSNRFRMLRPSLNLNVSGLSTKNNVLNVQNQWLNFYFLSILSKLLLIDFPQWYGTEQDQPKFELTENSKTKNNLSLQMFFLVLAQKLNLADSTLDDFTIGDEIFEVQEKNFEQINLPNISESQPNSEIFDLSDLI